MVCIKIGREAELHVSRMAWERLATDGGCVRGTRTVGAEWIGGGWGACCEVRESIRKRLVTRDDAVVRHPYSGVRMMPVVDFGSGFSAVERQGVRTSRPAEPSAWPAAVERFAMVRSGWPMRLSKTPRTRPDATRRAARPRGRAANEWSPGLGTRWRGESPLRT